MTAEQGTLFGECSHPHRVIVPEKRGPHFAKQLCVDCKRFLGWVAKPETIARRQKIDHTLSELAKVEQLSEWERQFIRDAANHRHLSPKQDRCLRDIRDRHLKKEG
jgi:hypothetical protein